MRSSCSGPRLRLIESVSTTYRACTSAPYFAAMSTACSTAASDVSLPSVGTSIFSYIVLVVEGFAAVGHDVFCRLLLAHRFGAVTLSDHLLGLERRFIGHHGDDDGDGEHDWNADECRADCRQPLCECGDVWLTVADVRGQDLVDHRDEPNGQASEHPGECALTVRVLPPETEEEHREQHRAGQRERVGHQCTDRCGGGECSQRG